MTAPPPPREWWLTLPYVTPPLNLNDRGHWAPRAKQVKAVRQDVALVARSAGLPRGLRRVSCQLRYRPRDNRRRDTDNLVATLKPLCDGLVDYGLVPDDTAAFMLKPEPVILDAIPRAGGRLWLVVTDLSAEAARRWHG